MYVTRLPARPVGSVVMESRSLRCLILVHLSWLLLDVPSKESFATVIGRSSTGESCRGRGNSYGTNFRHAVEFSRSGCSDLRPVEAFEGATSETLPVRRFGVKLGSSCYLRGPRRGAQRRMPLVPALGCVLSGLIASGSVPASTSWSPLRTWRTLGGCHRGVKSRCTPLVHWAVATLTWFRRPTESVRPATLSTGMSYEPLASGVLSMRTAPLSMCRRAALLVAARPAATISAGK